MDKRRSPVWKGPSKDGITVSLLSRFLCCRERFRLLVVYGLKPADTFNHRIQYGQLWHTAEEALAKGENWESAAFEYAKKLCRQYKESQEQVLHWYNVLKAQFPVYISYWSKHPDVLARKPLLQEFVFCVPYQLPDKRTVLLRGKFDSVDIIGKKKSRMVYLQENKTKGEVVEEQLRKQLRFDLQTMFYLVALTEWLAQARRPINKLPIGGVRYNVVRRPLAGGLHSIRQRKNETKEEFYNRLHELIKENAEFFFMRWTVEVTRDDIERFKREFLTPILIQLCNWWDWAQNTYDADPFGDFGNYDGIHWRTPYGFYNVLAEGGMTEIDEYLETGSELGLERTDNLFPELAEE